MTLFLSHRLLVFHVMYKMIPLNVQNISLEREKRESWSSWILAKFQIKFK